jgi:tetratricopeptide (TPR) repeat protein
MNVGHWALKLKAVFWLLLNRHAQAEAVFTEMLSRWPGDAYALSSRSHVRAQLRRRQEAIEDAQALVDSHPQRSAADWFNLAFLLEDAQRHDEAEAAFRRATEIDPKLDRAWYGLGLT